VDADALGSIAVGSTAPTETAPTQPAPTESAPSAPSLDDLEASLPTVGAAPAQPQAPAQ
jgi:preprotein translocase subunit SecG